MKKFIPLLLFLLFAGCLGSPPSTDLVTSTTITEPLFNKTAVSGDVVTIEYIMRVDGEIFDSTNEEIANTSKYPEFASRDHIFGYEPLSFVLGSGHMNPEFNTALLGMKPGDKKIVMLPPEKTTWGQWRADRVQTMERFSLIPIVETIPTPLFSESFGVEPVPGLEFPYEYWNTTVIEVNEEVTTLRHKPENGSVLDYPGGKIRITYNESIITMEFVPKINITSMTVDGRYVTIISSTETHMTVDYNHPLAGKTMEVEITLINVSNPVEWLVDMEKALSLSAQSKKPVFLLFTNVGCVNCRRIEFETLTHPFNLALKDSFIWTKIDNEIQTDVALKYGAEELPLILILKDGKEIHRISTFLPSGALRAEMEEALAKE